MRRSSTYSAGDVAAYLPLTPGVFHILLALADQDRHGYAIILDVAGRTGDAVRLGTGTLYTAIARLLEQRLIEESDERPVEDEDDERRRYYRLTAFGREVANAEARRLAALVRMARGRGITGAVADGRAR
ncbi:MAG: PadR family transcriptional regulator [Vicinamibacterales bacterium]